MVYFVPFAQSPQDRNRLFHRRFTDVDRGEPPFKCRVLLDVLAVLVKRRRAHTAEDAAGQRGFEHVPGIHRAFRSSCPHNRVQLVDEENDLTFRRFNFLEHRFEAFLKLAPEFRSGDHGTKVQRNHPASLEGVGDLAGDNALRKPFHNSRFPHARIADQDRVVFPAAREDLDDPTNLLISADHRVKFAFPRCSGQVPAELFERLVARFCVGVGDPLAPADFFHRLEDLFLRDTASFKDFRRLRVFLVEYSKQEVLDGDVLVLEFLRAFPRSRENSLDGRRCVHLYVVPLNTGQPVEGRKHLALDGLDIPAASPEYFLREILLHLKQRQKEVLGFQLVVVPIQRCLLSSSQRVLRALSHSVGVHCCHIVISPS
ncbi:MAG: hypothetical protein BWY06_02423 [Candidatus Latescibacteria bacterium ADurb.Bin168]|nr:MAG: hypothetical protein BWY06_02423 [Candidatus Latescibacteria bacterium ADurb.Bin168]